MENKFKEITLMNAILCIGVVVVHLTSQPLLTLTYGTPWHIVMFVINKILCYSVPAFLFLSGFKLFNKYKNSKIDLKRFYWGRFKKIVIPYIASVLVYFAYFFSKSWVSVSELPQFILLGTLAAHFYYIVIAVQLYLVFPLLKYVFEKSPKVATVASLICTVCCLLFLDFQYIDRFFGAYLIYFVLGMLAAEYKLYEKIKKFHIVSVVGFIVTGIVHLYFVYKSLSGTYVYRLEDMVHIVYIVFAIFALYGTFLIVSDKSKVLYTCARAISKKSFSIYLYHILVIFILQYDVYPYINLSAGEQFIVTSAVVFLAMLVYVVLKIPKFKKS